MRGAIYSRVSTEIQDYGKQTDELKDYAARNNIEVKYIFEEKVSGFKDDRTEFKKLEKLTKNDIDLVWELSRLSRRSIFIQQTVKNFANKGICIFTKKEGLYTLNDDDGTENKNAMFTIGVISMIAEQEIETLKERTISSKRRYILKEGHSYTPIAPYGYNYNLTTKQLTINEDEAEVVRRMYQLSIDGVRDILHNPVYKGVPKYTMTIRNKKVVELVSAPPIVSEEVFEQSEKELTERRNRSKSEMVNKPLLRALIFCTDCGRRYICSSGKSIYACQTRFDNIRANYVADCHSAGISATNIEPIIWNLVERLFKSTIASSKAQERIEPYQEQLSKLSESKNNFEMQRDKINKDAAKLFDTLLLIRDTNPTVFTSKMEDFNKMSTEANDYQKEIDIIESKKQAIQRRIKAIEEIKDIDITDESEKYDILHKVIEAIKIYSVKTNQKVFTVLFASGLEYNVLYNVNKPKFRIEYAFVSDETITFNKKDKLLINKLYSSVRDILPDFSITAGNNDMFDNDVCGDYSFQEVWKLLEKYNKTEVLREWKPDYTKRAINRRNKK